MSKTLKEMELELLAPETMLFNGDCIQVMDKLIEQGVKVDAIITDPPYNLVGKMGGEIHLFRQSKQDKNDNYSEQSMSYDTGFCQSSWLERIPKLLKTGGNIVIFNDWENMGDIAKDLRKLKIKVKSMNHWQKTNPQPAEWRRRFVSGREYFLYATKSGKHTFNVNKLHKGHFEFGITKQSEKKKGKHPNQKPLNLMCELIEILTNEGDTVLDAFMGSGSTGVAAKALNRNFIGIEKNNEYFNLAESRINDKQSLFL